MNMVLVQYNCINKECINFMHSLVLFFWYKNATAILADSDALKVKQSCEFVLVREWNANKMQHFAPYSVTQIISH